MTRALVVVLLLLAFPALAEAVETFEGTVSSYSVGSKVRTLTVRAEDGAEMIFWIGAKTVLLSPLPYEGMPVRVRFEPDHHAETGEILPGFGSALDVALSPSAGPDRALAEFLAFRPVPGEFGPGTTAEEVQARYPFLGEDFVQERFFDSQGRLREDYADRFLSRGTGSITSRSVSGDRATFGWFGWVEGPGVPDGGWWADVEYVVTRGRGWRLRREAISSPRRDSVHREGTD